MLLAHLALLQGASLLRLPLGGAAAPMTSPVTAPMHTRLLAAAEAPALAGCAGRARHPAAAPTAPGPPAQPRNGCPNPCCRRNHPEPQRQPAG
ncbi:MAG: hypothetical protein HZY78_05285 [Burkholderiaceae bacterium]|nr:MAG: hypothetical protein HZY78_05285 [Burkholderiaceae bacterium]